ncbi:hypothetical protein WA158_000991 [Blastocystis sp. Blastoise]
MSSEGKSEDKYHTLDKVENILAPSLTRKILFLVIYMTSIGIQIVKEHTFSIDTSYPTINANLEHTFITKLLTFACFIRILALALAYGGFFHNRLTPWTIGTSISFVACICDFISFLVTYFSPPDPSITSSKCIGFIAVIIVCNSLTLLSGTCLCYQISTLYAKNEKNSDMSLMDPQEEFVNRFFHSFVTVIPGFGFAANKIVKMVKLD